MQATWRQFSIPVSRTLVFVAFEVVGGEDLQVTEAGADGVFAKPAGHEGEVSAGKKQVRPRRRPP